MTLHYETLKSVYCCSNNCGAPETPFYLITADKNTKTQKIKILCQKCWIKAISNNLRDHLFKGVSE